MVKRLVDWVVDTLDNKMTRWEIRLQQKRR